MKARKLEWEQVPHRNGEHWVGKLDGRVLADVFVPKSGNSTPHFTMYLDAEADQYADCATVESGKRGAQRRLNALVAYLTGTA